MVAVATFVLLNLETEYSALVLHITPKVRIKVAKVSCISIILSIIYLPSGTRGVVAQSPEPEAHDESD